MLNQRRYTRREVIALGGKASLGIAAGAAMAACGTTAKSEPSSSKPSSSKPVTLTVWMVGEPSRVWIQDHMVSAFESQYPDIKLNVFKADFTTYYQKLATNIAGGVTPDVFMMSGAYFYEAAHLGALMKLDDNMKRDNIRLSDYYGAASGEDVVWKGNVYGIPGEIDVMGFAYNKTMFDAANLAYPKPGWTWGDLADAAKTLTRTRKDGTKEYGFYSWNSSQELWGDLVYENGGSFLDSSRTRGALQSAASVRAIQFGVDLIFKQKVSPTASGVSSLPGYISSGGSPFLTGTLGMHFQGNYELDLLSAIKSFEWDVTTMPGEVAKTGQGWFQSWVASSTTRYPDEAWELLKFFVTTGQEITAKAPGRGLTPSLISAATSPAFLRKAPPHVISWLEAWKEHCSFDFHPAWFQYQDAYSAALAPCFTNDAPVKAAIDSATPKVNAALAQYPWFSSKDLESTTAINI